MKSATDVWFTLCSSSSPKVLDEAEVSALCRPAKVFHTEMSRVFLQRSVFVHDETYVVTGKG